MTRAFSLVQNQIFTVELRHDFQSPVLKLLLPIICVAKG